MGLDMYAYRTKQHIPNPVDFEINKDDSTDQIRYWRKFNNLHGWMERLYLKKGGTQEFNCVPVQLTAEDLNQLEQNVQTGHNLNPQSGFFFGPSEDFNDEMKEEILSFVREARAFLAEGYNIYYDSWW